MNWTENDQALLFERTETYAMCRRTWEDGIPSSGGWQGCGFGSPVGQNRFDVGRNVLCGRIAIAGTRESWRPCLSRDMTKAICCSGLNYEAETAQAEACSHLHCRRVQGARLRLVLRR